MLDARLLLLAVLALSLGSSAAAATAPALGLELFQAGFANLQMRQKIPKDASSTAKQTCSSSASSMILEVLICGVGMLLCSGIAAVGQKVDVIIRGAFHHTSKDD